MNNSTNCSPSRIEGSVSRTLIPSKSTHDRFASGGTAGVSWQQAIWFADNDDESISPQGPLMESTLSNSLQSIEPGNTIKKRDGDFETPNSHAQVARSDLASAVSSLQVTNSETWSQPKIDRSEALFNVFSENVSRTSTGIILPSLDARIDSTPQLALCISLLSRNTASPLQSESRMTVSDLISKASWTASPDGAEQEWIKAIEGKSIDQFHLRWLGSCIVEEFIKHAVKSLIAVSEVVLLSSVLDQEHYRKLLDCFIEEADKPMPINLNILQGLVQLVHSAPPTYLEADDFIKILNVLRKCLGDTNQQSSEHRYHLTLAVSHLFDAMAELAYQVEDLPRIEQREPLAAVLSGLQASSDPYLMYQALYAFQTLHYVRDDESTLQTIMRYSLGAAESLIKVSEIIQLNFDGLLEGLRQMQKTFEESHEMAKSSHEGASSLIDSGRELFDSLKNGHVSGLMHPWYPAVLTARALCRAGQLKDLSQLVREVPCRRDPKFQWGVSQLLGEVAIDQKWLLSIREQAVTFLGGLYLHDADWGQDDSVRSWMLTILCKISVVPDLTVSDVALTLLQSAEQDGCTVVEHPYPLRSYLPIPETSPLLAIVQEIPTVEYDLDKLRTQRLKEYKQTVYIPPQAKDTLMASDKESVALMQKVEEFLKSDGQVFLVLGDSGTGKSTFNRYLEHELWAAYKPGGNMPLFINLPAIRSYHDIIGMQLRIYNFPEVKIKELKRNRKMILICDGYDETELTVNLHSANMFNQEGQADIKMIISCRSTYLGPNYRDQFRPQKSDRYNATAADVYTEAVIVPFSRDQIEDYTDQFVRDSEVHKLIGDIPVWSTEDYMDTLRSIPNLMELVRNPFLLSLSLQALPGMVKDRTNTTKIQVTRLALYNSFTEHWLDVNKRRLEQMKLSAEASSALEELLDDGFTTIAFDFLMSLAAAMFEEQEGNPVVQYTHGIDRETWKVEFFGSQPYITLLREASPLVRSGAQYRFIHRSLLEYFYSRHIYETSDTIDVLSNVSEGLAKHPLSQKNLVKEPSIIQFLAEHAQDSYDFRQKLHQIIERSKTDDLASQAAANAVTVLFKSGVRLSSIDMQGTRIPGADLSEGELDSAQLQGADLSNVNFSRSWLRQANFSHATMSGAQFGEWPFLEVDAEPTVCAYSVDGKTLAIGFSKGGIIFYDTTTWKSTFNLPGHLKAITAMAFSPTNNRLFSASRDSTWKAWDLNVREPAWIDNSHGGIVTDIVVSMDGLRLATSGADKLIRLWDPSTLKQVNLLKGHDEVVTCLAFSPCGCKLVSGSGDRNIRLWDTSNGRLELIVRGHSNTISSVTFAPHGRQIVSGSFDTSVRVWDVSTGNQIAILGKHTDRISTVTWSPSGTHIVSASWDKTVRVWDAMTYDQVTVLRGATKSISSVAVSPKGLQQIAACSNDNTVRLWDASPSLSSEFSSGTFVEGVNADGHMKGISTMTISTDGLWLATGGYDATVRACNASTGESNGVPLRVHTKVVAAIAFSLCGRLLASSSWDHTLRLWSNWGAKWCEFSEIVHGHQAIITTLAFLPTGQLISGSADRSIRLWDVDSGLNTGMLHGHSRCVRSVACSTDGLRIVSGSEDCTVRIWNVQMQKLEATFKGHVAAVASVAFSPTGHQVASASEDNTIRLWDPNDDHSEPTVLHGHQGGVQCIAYSPSGEFLASGSDDNTAIIWNASSGSLLEVIGDVFGGVSSIVWMKERPEWEDDEKQGFIVGCKDGSIRAWRLSMKEDKAQVQLEWGTGFGNLVATKARIDGVVGLGSIVRELLMQRGAVEEQAT